MRLTPGLSVLDVDVRDDDAMAPTVSVDDSIHLANPPRSIRLRARMPSPAASRQYVESGDHAFGKGGRQPTDELDLVDVLRVVRPSVDQSFLPVPEEAEVVDAAEGGKGPRGLALGRAPLTGCDDKREDVHCFVASSVALGHDGHP